MQRGCMTDRLGAMRIIWLLSLQVSVVQLVDAICSCTVGPLLLLLKKRSTTEKMQLECTLPCHMLLHSHTKAPHSFYCRRRLLIHFESLRPKFQCGDGITG